jgi:hypothetical protein
MIPTVVFGVLNATVQICASRGVFNFALSPASICTPRGSALIDRIHFFVILCA